MAHVRDRQLGCSDLLPASRFAALPRHARGNDPGTVGRSVTPLETPLVLAGYRGVLVMRTGADLAAGRTAGHRLVAAGGGHRAWDPVAARQGGSFQRAPEKRRFDGLW